MFNEIFVRVNGKEKWVDAKKYFKYMFEDYNKVSYSNKLIDPYNTRVDKFYSNIPQHVLKAWRNAFPNVDITQECLKSKAWLLSNTNKAKKDFKNFTNRWLGKACQNGGAVPVNLSDRKLNKQIAKHNEYISEAQKDAAPPDFIKDIIKKTKEKISR